MDDNFCMKYIEPGWWLAQIMTNARGDAAPARLLPTSWRCTAYYWLTHRTYCIGPFRGTLSNTSALINVCHIFSCPLHTEAKTKRPSSCRWHFQMQFLEWKILHSDLNLIEACSSESTLEYVTTGTEQMTSYNLNQWCPSSLLMHIMHHLASMS